MTKLPLIRRTTSGLVAVLGAVVLIANAWNVGYFADLGEAAKRLGDDGTTGSLISVAAGLLLILLGALGAATSHLEIGRASAGRRTPAPQTAERHDVG